MLDDFLSLVMEVGDGNPGGIVVASKIMKATHEVDKDLAPGAPIVLMMLGEWGIRGSRLWVLYKDKCGEDIRKLLLLFRAAQLGFLDRKELVRLSDDEMNEIKFDRWDEIEKKILDKLPNFQR